MEDHQTFVSCSARYKKRNSSFVDKASDEEDDKEN